MVTSLERNLHNRSWLAERLRAEIIGPDPSGDPFELQADGDDFLTWEEFRKPKCQPNGEEILWQDTPIKRYGAALLFPQGVTEQLQLAEEADSTPEIVGEEGPGPDVRVDEVLEKKIEDDAGKVRVLADDTENYDVTLANSYRPSAMGISFLAEFMAEKEGIEIEASFATYRRVGVHAGYSRDAEKLSARDLWLRTPGLTKEGIKPVIRVSAIEVLNTRRPLRKWVTGFEGRLEIVIVSRVYGGKNSLQRLLTISLVNCQTKDVGRIDEVTFFQCGFQVRGLSGIPWIVSYPDTPSARHGEINEEQIIRLLYRDRQTFAIGHGCAAEWQGERPAMVTEVRTECMPAFETAGISADIIGEDRVPIRVSMRKLAGLDPSDDGSGEMKRLVDAYKNWIKSLEDLEHRLPPIPDHLRPGALLLIQRCKECLNRIEQGILFLKLDSPVSRNAREAFRLANYAMLIAQLRASREVRSPRWEDGRRVWDKPITNPDPAVVDHEKGFWRGFQIAFLLMSVRGICEPSHEDRELVDLIWFPTGGGKTEAYLGLTAFTIFFNRLAGLKTGGADIIMRYTLRLLTAQQFQRAALLFCAMEHVRRLPINRKILGEEKFRLGMWVGGDATPNTRSKARSALRQLQQNPDEENPFVLLKCPWCNAKFGAVKQEQLHRQRGRRKEKHFAEVLGYYFFTPLGSRAETVAFRCSDPECEFGYNPLKPGNDPLPILVIDEDIFDDPPNLIIGTVDKFAMLSWKPEIRAIFGINQDGKHHGLPPTLIIQDELHLISGPLGSMVGAYETLVEELCVYRNDGQTVRPKIVASTATISRAEEQVKALYARPMVKLFPPSGLEAGDSFFAREARNDDGTLKPGRVYVGILAPGHGSLQTTQARIYAALLQYPAIMPVANGDETERDPWWTLVCFFNSLRELGGASTLLVADARDYLRVILDRHGFSYDKIRQLLNWDELTSRIRQDKIPLAIQKLEIPFGRDEKGHVRDTIEALLASNIIEVGIDIDRLALMVIVGQPKTTSQYIQVSSRIGRSKEAPGLVVVAFSQSKPRDRSHYERFRTYHQRLYAQVEPTSVTPFSPPAVDRSLHGIIVGAVRQLFPQPQAVSPRPYPLVKNTEPRIRIEEMIERRGRIIDPQEHDNIRKKTKQRMDEWEAWDPAEYGGFGPPPLNPPLMHPAGTLERPDWNGHSWVTLTSLRDVDASCEAEITTFYNELQRGDD